MQTKYINGIVVLDGFTKESVENKMKYEYRILKIHKLISDPSDLTYVIISENKYDMKGLGENCHNLISKGKNPFLLYLDYLNNLHEAVKDEYELKFIDGNEIMNYDTYFNKIRESLIRMAGALQDLDQNKLKKLKKIKK